VKSVRLVPVPPGVVTETGPVVARFGTVATISTSELTSNDADLALNFTTEVPVYPVPVIVTVVPLGPLEGTKSATVGSGDGVTTKSTALAPVPSPSVTVTGPVVAVGGTVAVICVLLSTLKDVAGVPLKATSFAGLESAKPVPVIVTDVPVGPVRGRKTTTTGGSARAAGAITTSAPATASARVAPTVAVRRCHLPTGSPRSREASFGSGRRL
jgi:hypothetical protein